MAPTFSCDFPDCNFVCTKQADLRKHDAGHKNPSKLHHCKECNFVTLHARNLTEHENTHTNARPHKCDEIVDGKRCKFSSNCATALCKHRKNIHPHLVPDKGSRKRKSVHSQVDTQEGAAPPSSAGSSQPQTLHSTLTHESGVTSAPTSTQHPFSNNIPSMPSQGWNHEPYNLTGNLGGASSLAVSQNSLSHTFTTVPMPSPVFQDSTNNRILARNIATYRPSMFPCPTTSNADSTGGLGSVASSSNNSYDNPVYANSYGTFPTPNALHNTLPVHGVASGALAHSLAPGPAVVNSNLSLQYNFARAGVSTTFPLPQNHATASSRNSFCASIHSIQTPPGSLYSSLSSALETTSVLSASVQSESRYTADTCLPSRSYIDLSLPSPPAEAVHWDNNAYAEPDTPHVGEPQDNGCPNIFVDEPMDVDEPTSPHNNCAGRDVDLPEPPSSCVPPVPQDVPDDEDDEDNTSDLNDYMSPSLKLLLLETVLHEDEIFYRGTGREGCLCPEMMVDAGIEGWDKSVLKELTLFCA